MSLVLTPGNNSTYQFVTQSAALLSSTPGTVTSILVGTASADAVLKLYDGKSILSGSITGSVLSNIGIGKLTTPAFLQWPRLFSTGLIGEFSGTAAQSVIVNYEPKLTYTNDSAK